MASMHQVPPFFHVLKTSEIVLWLRSTFEPEIQANITKETCLYHLMCSNLPFKYDWKLLSVLLYCHELPLGAVNDKSVLYVAIQNKIPMPHFQLLLLHMQRSKVQNDESEAFFLAVKWNEEALVHEMLLYLYKKHLLLARDQTNAGKTALHMACEYGFLKLANLLLMASKKCCNTLLEMQDAHGKIPIMYLVESIIMVAVPAPYIDLIRFCIEVNPKSCKLVVPNTKQHVVHLAMKYSSLQSCVLLAMHNSEPLLAKKLLVEQDIDGKTPVHIAIANSNVVEASGLVKLLFNTVGSETCATIFNIKDNWGNTPFHQFLILPVCATESSLCMEALSLMCSFADITVKNNNGKSVHSMLMETYPSKYSAMQQPDKAPSTSPPTSSPMKQRLSLRRSSFTDLLPIFKQNKVRRGSSLADALEKQIYRKASFDNRSNSSSSLELSLVHQLMEEEHGSEIEEPQDPEPTTTPNTAMEEILMTEKNYLESLGDVEDHFMAC